MALPAADTTLEKVWTRADVWKELRPLREQMETADKELRSLREELTQQQEQRSKEAQLAKWHLEEADIKAVKLKQERLRLQQETSQLRAQLQEALEQAEEAEERSRIDAVCLSECRAEMQEEVSSSQLLSEQLRAQLAEAEDASAESRTEAAELSQELRQCQEEKTRSAEAVEVLHATEVRLKEELATAASARIGLEMAAAAAWEGRAALQLEVHALRAELRQAQEEREAATRAAPSVDAVSLCPRCSNSEAERAAIKEEPQLRTETSETAAQDGQEGTTPSAASGKGLDGPSDSKPLWTSRRHRRVKSSRPIQQDPPASSTPPLTARSLPPVAPACRGGWRPPLPPEGSAPTPDKGLREPAILPPRALVGLTVFARLRRSLSSTDTAVDS